MPSTAPDAVSNDKLDRIDDACQKFESSWQSPDSPRLEDFLDGFSDAEATLVFVELFHLELDYRSRRGDAPELQAYLQRFPQFGHVVKEVFVQRMSGSSDRTEPERINAARQSSGGLPELDGYEMVRRIGHGGMGVVYLARSQKLGRQVAIKMVALVGEAPEQLAKRFQIEAESIAKLQHPNIVQIFEVGDVRESGGRSFLVLEYLAGGNLKERLKIKPESPRATAQLMLKLAKGIHNAHSHGIIHRDLKPSNVLFDNNGEPKIADFGLAKVVHSTADATSTGQIIGTVQYMAPEQASASQVSAVTDVYSLGAILYEMLAHQPTFPGNNPLEILHRLTTTDVVPPSEVQEGVPHDLEAICLKCLDKDPAHRYGSAEGLADDLSRYLAGQPVAARPINRLERSAKWARRHPAVASMMVALFVVSVAAFGLVTWKWRVAIEQKGFADTSLIAEQTARAAETLALSEAQKATAKEKLALEAVRRERDLAEIGLHAAQLARASAEMDANYVGQAPNLLANSPVLARGWEHRYLSAECKRRLTSWAEKDIVALAGGCDSELLASLHREVKSGVVKSRIVIWDVANGTAIRTIDSPIPWASRIAFDQKSRLLVVCGTMLDHKGAVAIFDAQSGDRKLLVNNLPAEVLGVAMSSDGKRLACAGCGPKLDGIAILDAESGVVVKWLTGHVAAARSVAFSPSDDRLACLCLGGAIEVWDLATSNVVSNSNDTIGSDSIVYGANGSWIACSGRDEQVHLLNPETGRELFLLRGHRQNIESLAYDRRTNRLASADWGGNIKIWDVDGRKEVSNLNASLLTVRLLAFVSNGARLAAVDATRLRIDLWNLKGKSEFKSAVSASRALIVSRDNIIAYSSPEYQVATRDLATGKETVLQKGLANRPLTPSALALSPDGKLLAWGGDRTIKIWELASGKELHSFEGRQIESLVFHPDGRHLIGVDEFGIRFWDVARREVEKTIPHRSIRDIRSFDHLPGGEHLAISPDGTLLVYSRPTLMIPQPPAKGTFAGEVDVWNLETGDHRQLLSGNDGHVKSIAFRPDGKEFATAGEDSVIRIWNVNDWSQRVAMTGHVKGIFRLAYHPDGRRLISGGVDKALRIWDVEHGRELLSLSGHSANIVALCFHPTRDVLFTADATGAIRSWSAKRPIDDGGAFGSRLNPEQTSIAAVTSDSRARPTPPSSSPPAIQ